MTPVKAFRSVIKSKRIDEFSKAARELRLWMIENDPHMPIYHFTGPESWINDPNGVIFHEGIYHLFYQFDPIVDARRSNRCWGHSVSNDLVHWKDWPVALWPDTEFDHGGVFSGNMVMHDSQRINAESPVHWDAQIWKDGETWFQLIGGALEGRGAAHLWSSEDLEAWSYCKPIYNGPPGNYWELPYLIPFGDRHALFVGSGNPYWIGNYDKKSQTFTPDHEETKSIDNGNYYSFNLHMRDEVEGEERQLMHGWVTGPATPTETVPYWQGAHSIPRVITLRTDWIWQEPIPELQSLRSRHFQATNVPIGALLDETHGECLELIATFKPNDADRFGLMVRVSQDRSQFSRIYFEVETGLFGVDGQALEAEPQNSNAKPGDEIQLHIFLDRSIVEVYVNGSAQTARHFPDPNALGIEVFSDGGSASLRSLEIWHMKSIWE